MPLMKGKQNVGRNIKKLRQEGRPKKQAIAIAMRVAGAPRPRRARRSNPKPG